MLTSAGRPDVLTESNAPWIARFLVKPVKHSVLLDAILTALCHAEAEVAAGEASPTQAPCTGRSHSPRTLRVLLVEDGLVNQRVALGFLQRRGHEVEIAQDGAEAIAAWKDGKFDLILMDVQMPEMDGYKATALIRQQEEPTGDHIPIVAMTAHAMKGDRERCLAAGMDDYVPKPIHSEELYAAMDRAIKSRRAPPVDVDTIDTRVLDWNAALAQFGSLDAAREMATVMITDARKLLADTHAAFDSQDRITLHSTAHSLRGAAEAIHAAAMGQAASNVEGLAYYGELADIAQALAILDVEVERLVEAITQVVASPPGDSA